MVPWSMSCTDLVLSRGWMSGSSLVGRTSFRMLCLLTRGKGIKYTRTYRSSRRVIEEQKEREERSDWSVIKYN